MDAGNIKDPREVFNHAGEDHTFLLGADGSAVLLFGGRAPTADGLRDLNDTWQHADAYVSRLRSVDAVIDGMVAEAEVRTSAGVRLPLFAYPRLIEAAETQIAGAPFDEGDLRPEVERYIVWPAQALSYKIGMMTILELSERARAELGERFSWGGFHDAVLMAGELPLPIMTDRVNAWIEATR